MPRTSGATHLEHPTWADPCPGALEVLGRSGFGLNGNRLRKQIEQALGGAQLGCGDAQIAGGGNQAAMTEQQLDGAHVGSGFEQVGCKTVPKRMGCDRFGKYRNVDAPSGRLAPPRPW